MQKILDNHFRNEKYVFGKLMIIAAFNYHMIMPTLVFEGKMIYYNNCTIYYIDIVYTHLQASKGFSESQLKN